MAELVSYMPEKGRKHEESGLSMNGEKATNGILIEEKMPAANNVSETETVAEKKKKEPVPTVGFLEVFRFSDCWDRLLMICGSLCAVAYGVAMPAMIIVFGEMIDLFVNSGVLKEFLLTIIPFLESVNLTVADVVADQAILLHYCPALENFTGGNITCDALGTTLQNSIMGQMSTFAIYYVLIGCGVIFCGYVQVSFWMTAGERQTHRIRVSFFTNVIHQEIGWFDTHEAGELNTRLSDDIGKIHDGIGDKVGSAIQWVTCFIAGFLVGFLYGWKLTLVILAVSPPIVVAAGLASKLAADITNKELQAYAKAGAIAEEVISAIRTVVAFGGQDKEVERYISNLGEARSFGIKKAFTQGCTMGFIWLIIFLAYALGFWYGAKLIRDEPETYSAGKMLIVFFSVLTGAFSLGNAGPGFQSLATARGAAYTIYSLIDQKSKIDSRSQEGKRPQTLIGNIAFRNVTFNYPSREEIRILDGLTLDVKQGQTVALVGQSGCGKSTTVQLLQRFYDPASGMILLDGTDIRELNIEWLRRQIGIVSQEPVLFGLTIEENIRYGREGITKEDVEQAARMANAHDYIMKLPDKYQTLVGERGAQLSGGQKQRVAIARALVRNPKILLLDEATSALDTESEGIVQDALDKARQGRTTIVIAHRLSTIKTADIIIGIDSGKVKEQGTHDELMAQKGIYHKLVTNQTYSKKKEDEEEEEIEAFARVGSGRSSDRQLKRMMSGGDRQLSRVRSNSESSEKKAVEKEEEKVKSGSFLRMMQMNSPEWAYILVGCFSALINGGIQPAFSIIFSEILGVFQLQGSEQEQKINIYVIVLVCLGVLTCIAMFMQGYMFGKAGESLTVRLRSTCFKAMLRQDIAWFDDHSNSTGALTTRLATDASLVQGATGVRLGTVVQNIANMGTAIIIAFIYGWKLTLLIFAFIPFIVAGGALEMKVLAGVAGKNKKALEGAGKVATEGLENMRTVASLSREMTFVQLYKDQLVGPYRTALRRAHLIGASFGVSQAVIYFAYAASFYLGAYLIKSGEMDFVVVFKVFGVVVFGAMAIGQASAFAPDASKAAVSAGKIFLLLDREPSIDSYSPKGKKLDEKQYKALVTFRDVHFRYPTRPEVTVLNGLDISVNPGQTLALVGSSGCGKSTSVQLLERFYDPETGSVALDGVDLRELNLAWLRSQMGIVSQEPILFSRSIAENIAYGDNSRVVTMDEIISAARSANIHNFIASLPNGYETNVGDKGAQLSGGQKQRVAIARALVRNPKILLLDEATSALDTESEKIVQEALDHAREGRTSIVIAHRLSTVQNADLIVVIRNGKVVEQGRHGDLLSSQGFYYKLCMAQQKQK